jgi:DNA-binding beta-propeller fold protein YncE
LSTQGLNKPEHLAVDRNGNIYVTNAGSRDISQFDSNGNFLVSLVFAGLPQDEFRLDREHDSDGDLVHNIDVAV